MDVIAAVQAYVSPAQAISIPYAAGAGKGKPVTHSSALATAAAAVKAVGLTGSDVVAVTAPLYTTAGLAAGAMAANHAHAKLVVPSKAFDAGKALAAISHHRATVLVATPSQVSALSAALAADATKPAGKREFDVSSLRAGLLRECSRPHAESLPPPLKPDMRDAQASAALSLYHPLLSSFSRPPTLQFLKELLRHLPRRLWAPLH